MEIDEIIGLIKIQTPEEGKKILKDYSREIIQQAINKISNQPIVFPPEEGEPDYGPGKYMAIGMLYEFKENLK